MENTFQHTLNKALKTSIREIDIPTRFSQEHTLVLLPHTDDEGAIEAATRLQRQLRAHDIPNAAKFTVSIGVTTSPQQQAFKFTDLLRDATKALREVQRQGGNGVMYG
ncbi:MAG: diguanylate cyclase [Myxococcota bacterium]